VLLRDSSSGQMYRKILDQLGREWISGGSRVARSPGRRFRIEDPRNGGDEFLRPLEDSLSNAVRLSRRVAVTVDDFPHTLRLCEERMEQAEVRPFVTHLPLYSLKAAVTKEFKGFELKEGEARVIAKFVQVVEN
jgi:hypothetical protein